MVKEQQLSDIEVELVQQLTRSNFAARDELYAAGEAIDRDGTAEICRKLAEEISGCACELAQMVCCQGETAAKPDDVRRRVNEEVINLLEQRHGQSAVTAEAERRLEHTKREYDLAIEKVEDVELEATLRRHRERLVFGETILTEIRAAEARQ